MHPAAALTLSYLCGSFPAAFLAGKSRGVDLRKEGSGNLGATNVLRILGPTIGAMVFAADTFKGFAPVFWLAPLSGLSGGTLVFMQLGCGVAAVLGHSRPAFLGFRRGGKGVATACGVFLALAPLQTAATLLTFSVVVLASGYVSLASISGAFALPVVLAASFGFASPLFPVGILTLLFVVWTHRENIKRLRAGTEYRFSKSAQLGIVLSSTIGLAVLATATAWLAVEAQR